MRYDATHKLKTRQRVLMAATQAIRAEGPHRVRVAGIMAKAGLTHGGFYAHFSSKDELIVAAIREMFAGGVMRMEKETAGLAPAAALSSYLDFYLSAKHRNAYSTGCPMAALAADMPRLPMASRIEYAAGVRLLSQALTQLVVALGHEDAESLTDSVLSELLGALSIARSEPDPARSDAILTASRRSLKQRLQLETHQWKPAAGESH